MLRILQAGFIAANGENLLGSYIDCIFHVSVVVKDILMKLSGYADVEKLVFLHNNTLLCLQL